jgi:hypothetical protein
MVIFTLCPIDSSPVVIGIPELRVYLKGSGEIRDSLVVLTPIIIIDSPTEVGVLGATREQKEKND